MGELFQQHLPDCKDGIWRLDECSIQHPRYKTYLNPKSAEKSYLALAYHLHGQNILKKQPESRILYAQAYLGRRSHVEFSKNQLDLDDDCLDSLIHIPDLGLIAWTFPCDPVLRWLPTLIEPASCIEYFSDLGIYKPDKVLAIIPTVINYRPKIRCTIRYSLQLRSKQEAVIYAKSYAHAYSHAIYLHINSLWQDSLNNSNSFFIAQPLCHDSTLNTVWQQGVTGQPLLNYLTVGNQPNLISSIAKGLVALHQQRLTGLQTITVDALLAEAKKKSVKLSAAFPSYETKLNRLITYLEVNQPNRKNKPLTLIHGDFHIQQLLLLETGRIALFDFDELALGDPLQDLANFCADLYNQNLDDRKTHSLITDLVNAYGLEAELNTKHFDWHLRLQLLTRAYRAYIQQKPNLEQVLKQFLDAARSGYSENHRDSFYVQ